VGQNVLGGKDGLMRFLLHIFLMLPDFLLQTLICLLQIFDKVVLGLQNHHLAVQLLLQLQIDLPLKV